MAVWHPVSSQVGVDLLCADEHQMIGKVVEAMLATMCSTSQRIHAFATPCSCTDNVIPTLGAFLQVGEELALE
eukprot:6461487-Amphidinium_carterae.2